MWMICQGVSEDIPRTGTYIYQGFVHRGVFCSDRRRNVRFTITEIISA